MLVRRTQIRLPAEADGMPAELWLAQRFTYLDLEAWREELMAGRLFHGEEALGPGDKLRAGAQLKWEAPPIEEPPVNPSWRVAYEDEEILVIDKPAGLPCHPGGRFFSHTLWAMLKEKYGDIHLISRLDRETSGLLLAAKTREAARRYSEMAAKGLIEKRYLVLVHGSFPRGECAARGWLVPDASSAMRKKRAFVAESALRGNGAQAERPPEGAESCETRFICLGQEGGFSFLLARPVTGRTHQIRASLFSLGYPVVGDKLYGLDDTLFDRFARGVLTQEDEARLVLPHQALHSFSITMRRGLGIEAPPPWIGSFPFLSGALAGIPQASAFNEEGPP